MERVRFCLVTRLTARRKCYIGKKRTHYYYLDPEVQSCYKTRQHTATNKQCYLCLHHLDDIVTSYAKKVTYFLHTTPFISTQHMNKPMAFTDNNESPQDLQNCTANLLTTPVCPSLRLSSVLGRTSLVFVRQEEVPEFRFERDDAEAAHSEKPLLA